MSLYKDEKEKSLFEFVKTYSHYERDIKAWWKYNKKFPERAKLIKKPFWKDYIEQAKKFGKWEGLYGK